MIIVSFAISILSYTLSLLLRNAFFRIIPCCKLKLEPEILMQGLKNVIIFLLTFVFSILAMVENGSYLLLIFEYRAFNRLYNAPHVSAIEAFILFIYLVITNDYS